MGSKSNSNAVREQQVWCERVTVMMLEQVPWVLGGEPFQLVEMENLPVVESNGWKERNGCRVRKSRLWY
jgi:hypothetical protein